MRLVKIMKRGGEDLYEYKKALRKAKEAIEMLCDISGEMEERYSERDEYEPHHRDEEYSRMEERPREANWRYR